MTFQIFNVTIDHVSESQLETILRGWISGQHQKKIFTPNAEILLDAKSEPAFQEILNKADLSLPDTVSLRFAVAAQGEKMKFRHPGSDTLERLAKICHDTGDRLMLFGASPGNAEKAVQKLKERYKGIDVIGIDPGIVSKNGEGWYLDEKYTSIINEHKPTVLAVALGQKKQEQFILEYLEHLPSVRIAIGVGGAFEMIAEILPRAPRLMRKLGFEWVWRVVIEPSRYRRIIKAFILFPAAIAYDTLKRGRFIFAVRHVTPEVIRQIIGK